MIYSGSFSDREILNQLFNNHPIAGVVHLAAQKNASESNQLPSMYWEKNFHDSVKLVKFLEERNVKKIIFASSAAIYGESLSSGGEFLVSEESLCLPKNVYGMTKLAFEEFLRHNSMSSDFQAISLRFFNIGGWSLSSSKPEKAANLFPLLNSYSKSGKALKVFGTKLATKDGSQVRDYVHIDDICQAIVKSIDYLEGKEVGLFEAFNVGSGVGTTVLEAIAIFEEVSHRELRQEVAEYRDSDPIGLVANTLKATSLLGWSAEHALRDIAVSEVS
jgi:UDP-glucose 4-epimerase